MSRIRFHYESVISITAIFIALMSMAVSIWYGLVTRKHYRLSVRPKLNIEFFDHQDNFGYNLMNNGLGPATIERIVLTLDGEQMDITSGNRLSRALRPLAMEELTLNHDAVHPGKTIRPAGQLGLVQFTIPASLQDSVDIMDVYRRVKIEIDYQSMYDETFTTSVGK